MIRRKWKSRRGETLIETLVSLLISSLALTMLAGMIFKSARLLNNSMEDMQGYTEEINLLNNPQSVASGAMPGLSAGDATVTISVSSGDAPVSFSIPVWYVLDDTGENPIISYVKSGA